MLETQKTASIEPPAAPHLDPQDYSLSNPDDILTPSLVVYPDWIQANIDRAIAWAGGEPNRLRPHAKTHKTAEVTRLQAERGITKHKCATLVEADLLARNGARDILLAYPMVGPNIGRFKDLVARYSGRVQFQVLVDHAGAAENLSAILSRESLQVSVLVDLDAGMGRTGVPLGRPAGALAERIARLPGLRLGGLHLYDGDVDSPSPAQRLERVTAEYAALREQASAIESAGLPVERLVVAGTGTFAAWLHVAREEPRLEASPGTFVYSDWNYHTRFADLGMVPAAVLFTRVISRPRAGRFTCDLGHKAVAADPLKEDRVHFLDLPGATFVRQNEEHLVMDTPLADALSPGDLLLALPYHICPTCALHRDVYVAQHGRVTGQWQVAARDRSWS
jgi:D-serine deaminase-like pyridoxal phosphate-dependent protein